jgi:hypothetical protein
MPATGPDHPDATATGHTVVVKVVTDEGMPTKISHQITADLLKILPAQLDAQTHWRVHSTCHRFMINDHGLIPVLDLAERLHAGGPRDVLILLTDLPRRVGTQPIVSDYNIRHRVALVSLPALGGGFRITARLRNLLLHLIGHLTADDRGLGPRGQHPNRLKLPALAHHIHSRSEGIDGHLALSGLRGRLRLLRGMVHDNRPWRLVPHLASATAAAAATAAFGIFYSSIWQMAEALPLWRLALITILAIAAMVGWLTVYNHLWDLPSGHDDPGKAALYNTSTILTLTLGVSFMYGLLYLIALFAAGAVIDAGYLQTQLKLPRSAGIGDYTRLVWLSCSMGIVAGALGSNLDGEDAVRQVTYSRRERERLARNRAQAESTDASGGDGRQE